MDLDLSLFRETTDWWKNGSYSARSNSTKINR